jgi:hypothetical protein
VPPVPPATIGKEAGTQADDGASPHNEVTTALPQAVPPARSVTAETPLVQEETSPVPPAMITEVPGAKSGVDPGPQEGGGADSALPSKAVLSVPAAALGPADQGDVPPAPPARIVEDAGAQTEAATVRTEEERSFVPKND